MQRLARAVGPVLRARRHPRVPNAPVASVINDDRFRSGSGALMGLAAALAAGFLGFQTNREAECCGIVGIVGRQGPDDARDFLLEGLHILRNRGYDSAGMATLDEEKNIQVSKFASRGHAADSMELLKDNSSKTDKNAHPHMDFNNRIALVHNGTINNAGELRQLLEGKGIEFRSETDTEVIAHLIGLELDQNPGCSTKEATRKALSQCDGTWGLAVVNKSEPDRVVIAANGSPMVIGIGNGRTFIASETAAFSRYTKNFIAMNDGEIGEITSDKCSLDSSRMEVAPDQQILLSPAPYPHWTLREAMQQPEAIARALAFGGRMGDEKIILGGPERERDMLSKVKHLLVAACGTSLYAAMYGAKLMRDLDAFSTAVAMDAAELRESDFPEKDGGLLVVSQSGETRDVVKAVHCAAKEGIPALSAVNVVGSAVARLTKLGVYLNAGRETAVASTKAFTTQVTVLSLLALWFRQLREEKEGADGLPLKRHLLDALQRLPISFGMALRTRSQAKAIAERIVKAQHCFVLGKGYGEPVAYEGALKLKEMAYLHAEGYSGGALKHGPFALIEDSSSQAGPTPIILLILDDEHAHQMRTCGAEVLARGADVIVITDKKELARGLDADPILIPHNGPLTALIAVLPLQFLAYELAILRGNNPDTPRNLAKAVTTD